MNYFMTIGLETHVQLKTKTKLFCGCPVTPLAASNTSICPVCAGHPGTLPVLNKKALELGIRAALAFNCSIPSLTKFDRKNYFYPDLPKGYQITQWDYPIGRNGSLKFIDKSMIEREVAINRIHIEEDAGKLTHMGTSSAIDLNRAGTPLIEIVTEPCFHDFESVNAYLNALKNLMNYLDISDCAMEKGSLRCDVNISLSPEKDKLGAKVEIKNMNSFRHIGRAIEYEISRHSSILDSGKSIPKETRLWNEELGITELMRSKEDSNDYRYFPEPDLKYYSVSDEMIEKERIPETPWGKRIELIKIGVAEDASYILTETKELTHFTESVLYPGPSAIIDWATLVSSFILKDVLHYLSDNNISIKDYPISAKELRTLLLNIHENKITRNFGINVLKHMIVNKMSALKAIDELSPKNIDIDVLIAKTIESNPKAVSDYKGGKVNAIKSLLGAIMRETKGTADYNDVMQKLELSLK